jgi:hypothetical protein
MRLQPDVNYKFTRDPNQLQEYYSIREQCYKSVWGLQTFSGEEDKHDRNGHLLIARIGNRVIGGARLVIKQPESPSLLPMEEDGFNLQEILPEYRLENQVHGEVGRFSILPEFCGGNTLFLGLHLLAMAQTQHCRYLSTVAPEEQAKKYVSIGKRYGFELRVIDDIVIPDRPYYNKITMKLLISDLSTMPDVSELL